MEGVLGKITFLVATNPRAVFYAPIWLDFFQVSKIDTSDGKAVTRRVIQFCEFFAHFHSKAMVVSDLLNRRKSANSAVNLLERLESDQLDKAQNQPMECMENWGVAFAPDHSHFAWSCGDQTVCVLPCVGLVQSNQKRPVTKIENSTGRTLMIQCDDDVRSVAFGSSCAPSHSKICISEESQKISDFYNFRSIENRLILAIGLKHGRIRLYSIYGAKFITELMDHRGSVRQVRFSPDDPLTLFSASHDSTLKLWNLYDDCNMFKTLTHHSSDERVTCCAFSPNGRFAASGGTYSTLFVYCTRDWSFLHNLHGHLNTVNACEFSPDSALLASASYDTTVILWDFVKKTKLLMLSHLLPSPRLIYASGSNGHYVRSLSFSPDGEHISTVCDDGMLRIWSIFDSGQSAISAAEVLGAVCTAFSSDGSIVSAGTKKGQAYLFASCMRVQSLQQICRLFLRKLTQLENIEFLPLSLTLKSFLRYEYF